MKAKGEFELSLKMGLAHYIDTGSVIHRLDPRFKILSGIILVTVTLLCSGVLSLLVLIIFILLLQFLSKVKLAYTFGVIKPVLPFIFIIALIQIFAVPQLREGSRVILQWKIFIATDMSIRAGILLIGKFFVIVIGLSFISMCTTTSEVIHGVEGLLLPFQKLGLPAHELSLVSTIAIRFLPILVNDTEKLMKAQASRGADFGQGSKNFLKRMRKMLPLFVPLFVMSLHHAYNLAEAMEARCYTGGRGRTYYVRLKAKKSDYVFALLIFVVFAFVLVLSFSGFDEKFWKLLFL